jgi:maleylpyruvate isomerase
VPEPDDDALGATIEGATASTRRLLAGVSALDEDDVRRPSLLPGWTVAHVLAHLVGNAESHTHLLGAARRGEVADQYPGGPAQREGDIAARSRLPVADLVAALHEACRRLEEAWAATPPDVWRHGRARVSTGEWPLAELPFRRWRELELHSVDLGLGYRPDDWPEAYVREELDRAAADLGDRLPPGTAVRLVADDLGWTQVAPAGAGQTVPVTAPARALLAWLVGRAPGASDPAWPATAFGPRRPALGPWEGTGPRPPA